jgi:hypothetical protein
MMFRMFRTKKEEQLPKKQVPEEQRCIRIVTPPTGQGLGTTVWWGDEEVKGVISVELDRIDVDSLVTATLHLHVGFTEIWAFPFMSEDNFLAAAKRYGYTVTKE